MGGGGLCACPQIERAPLIHWMAERNSEKATRQRTQDMVELYG